ncbi:MAG: TonB-dependent receptor [Deltaproteobacteria bacterium]
MTTTLPTPSAATAFVNARLRLQRARHAGRAGGAGSAASGMDSGIEGSARTIQRFVLGSWASALCAFSTPASAQPESSADASARAAGIPGVVAPRPLAELSVAYPSGASGERNCIVELVVGKDGVPGDVLVLDCPAPFAQAAETAARGWRFAPAERKGTPVAAKIRWQVHFEDSAAAPEPPVAGTQPTERAPATPSAAAAPAPTPLEVTVRGVRSNTGARRLTRAEVRELPGAFGDAFRAIEALPGVTPITSGLPYFFVRGAPPGNTGYFIDGVSIPTLYHAAVGPSVIHPAFIENVELFSGAYPARYGRFAGAILAGTSAPARHELRGEASVRLVDSGGFLELPIAGDRASVMLAGRYSYTGALVSLLVPEIELGYWDYQARASYRLSDDHTLTLFGFGAHDFLSAEQDGVRETVYDVTFHRLDLSSRQAFGQRSGLDLGLTLGWDQTSSGVDERLALDSRRLGARAVYRSAWDSAELSAGGDFELSRFGIDISEDPDGDDDDDEAPDDELLELPDAALPIPAFDQEPLTGAAFQRIFSSRTDRVAGAWLESGLDLGAGVTFTPGFRLDLYESGGTLRVAPEPRLRARFALGQRLALVHDLGIAHQAPSFAIPVPGFSGRASEPLQRGVQASAGVEWQATDATFLQWTLFQTALFGGSDPISLFQLDNADESVEGATARVTAHTYGMELYVRRELTRRFGGFLSYTLARSVRSTGRLEGPSSIDRTHVLNLAAAYRLGQSWRLGARFVFYSGRPGEVAYPRAARQPPRGPAFYRLDLRVEKRWALGETGFWALVAEVQNATLGRETTDVSCYAYGCATESIGPVTVPSLGLEASF